MHTHTNTHPHLIREDLAYPHTQAGVHAHAYISKHTRTRRHKHLYTQPNEILCASHTHTYTHTLRTFLLRGHVLSFSPAQEWRTHTPSTTNFSFAGLLDLLAFIAGNSTLVPLLEGILAQIRIDLSWQGFGRNRTGDLRMTQIYQVPRSSPLSYGDGCITEDPSGPFQ